MVETGPKAPDRSSLMLLLGPFLADAVKQIRILLQAATARSSSLARNKRIRCPDYRSRIVIGLLRCPWYLPSKVDKQRD